MDIERQVSNLEKRTEALFEKEVPCEELGVVLTDATRLWLRQCLCDDWPVVELDDYIEVEDFPATLAVRLERVIKTLEFAFDGDREDEMDLMKKGHVKIDGWIEHQN